MNKDTKRLKQTHRIAKAKAKRNKKKQPSLKAFARAQIAKCSPLSDAAQGWFGAKGGK